MGGSRTTFIVIAALAGLAGFPAAGRAAPAPSFPIATEIRVGGDDTETRFVVDLTDKVDLTASAAVGLTYTPGVSGEVFGVGTVSSRPQTVLFAEYGVRMGWEATENSRLEGFVQGSTGTGIGTHAQIGAAYRLKF